MNSAMQAHPFHRAGVNPRRAGDARQDVHERALARAVLAQHGVDLARKDFEVHPFEERHPRKRLGDSSGCQERGLV